MRGGPEPVAASARDVISLWLAGLRSKATRKAYSHDLKLAESIVGDEVFALSRKTVGRVVEAMKARGYSVNSTRRMACCLRILAGELAAYEVIPLRDYMGIKRMKLEHPKVDRAGRYLERPERAKLFKAAEKAARTAREVVLFRAVLSLGLGAGLRYNEVRSLRSEDYDPETGQVRVWQAKGGKERYVYLAGEAKRFMDEAHKMGVGFGSFTHGLWDSLRYHAELDEGIVFHDLRRTFASDAWDAGIDGSTIAAILGHENIQTSMLYDRRSEDRKKRAAKVMMGIK